MMFRLYYYDRNTRPGHKPEKLDASIKESVVAFKSIYGYFPDYAEVRVEEVKFEMRFPIPIVKVEHGCPPGHYKLCPVVQRRTPVVFNGRRTPWLKKN